LRGHEGTVWSVGFSPDGTRIVSGGDDGTVRLWTPDGAAAGEPLRGHEGTVWSVGFSPDGTRIVSGGHDGTVRLWTPDGAAVGEPLRGHEGTVWSVGFSPDGTRIVSGGRDGTVRLWTRDGAAVGEPLRGHDGMVFSVGFSPDGTRIVSGGEDGTVRLWTPDGRRLLVFRGSVSGVPWVAINDVGQIVSGNWAGQIHVFQPEPTLLLPPPWTWLAPGFSLALLGAASAAWRRAADDIRREAAHREQRVPAAAAFLDAEGPLERPDLAGPAMSALVHRLSGFIRNRDTATPFTFALAGEWGSGKSSVMRLLQDDLERAGFPTIWFNVWHHQNEEHLFAALMEAIRTEAAPSLMSFSAYRWHPLAFRRRLLVERMQAHPLRYALQLAVAIFFVILLWKLVPTVDMRTLPEGLLKWTDQGIVLVKLAASLGAFWLALRELVLPFNVKPGALLASSDGWLGTRSFNDRLGFRQTFATAFGEVTRAMGDRRLTILIDDLDRCRPDRVVDLLEAVNFLTSNGNCFVVLGLSEGPVTAAIGLSFKEIADERVRPTRRRGREAKPAAAARLAFARNYLEKLVTLRVPVPAFDGAALRNWLDNGGLQARSARPSGWREFARALPLLLCFGCFAIGAALLAREVAGPIGRTWDTAPKQQTDAMPPPPTGQAGVPAPVPQAGDSAAAPPVNPAGDPLDDLQRRSPDRGYIAPAAPHWTADLHWLAAGLLLVVPLLLLSPSCRRYVFGWISGVESGVRRDSDEYRRAFGLWAPLVLSSRGSPRAIKRFANRMRYLTSDVEVRGNEGKIAALVALGALDEAGLLDAARGVAQLATLRHFGTIEALDAGMLAAIGAIAPADWDDYWVRTGTPMAPPPATPTPPAAE
ncbi:P-loop NTPase fold protein, partial [Methylobrevis albus]